MIKTTESNCNIFHASMQAIARLIRRGAGTPADVEDAVAQVRLSLLRRPVPIDFPSQASLTAYLQVGAIRILSRRQMAQDGAPRVASPNDVFEAIPAQTQDPLSSVLVQDALSRLSQADRQILTLDAAGLSAHECAQRLGISDASARQRLCRSRHRLRLAAGEDQAA